MKRLEPFRGPTGLHFGPYTIGLATTAGEGSGEARNAGNEKKASQYQWGVVKS